MKKLSRIIISCVLVLTIICFTGCASAQSPWAAKYEDDTMPIGVYIYYLFTAVNDAQGEVEDSETDLLKQTIDEKPAETWIREKAEWYTNKYYTIKRLMNERGISLDDIDVQNTETLASSYWAQMSSRLDELGVSYESFKKVMTMQYESDKIFRDIYTEGGEKEVSDEELSSYFEENYIKYNYGASYMYSYDDDGKYNLLTDEEQAEMEEKIQKQLDRFNKGELSMEELEKELAKEEYRTSDGDDEEPFAFTEALDKVSEGSEISDALVEAENGKAVLVNTGAGMIYILIKEDIKEESQTYIEDENNSYNLIWEIKSEEFENYLDEETGKTAGTVEYNEKAINGQKISKFLK